MNIQSFNFQNQSVRVEFKNGEPLFCLTDVAEILLLKNANPTRFNLKNDGIHKMYSVDSKGRKNEITFINEPNLYRVIFRSNKPEAVKFQDWIFEEVIPQIRKTGGYQTSGSLPLHQPQLPTEYFAHLAKMAHYAEDYQKIQSLLCTDPKGEQAQKLMTSFNYSTNSNQTGYLFVFKPNIQQDVKQAFDFLYQYSQKI